MTVCCGEPVVVVFVEGCIYVCLCTCVVSVFVCIGGVVIFHTIGEEDEVTARWCLREGRT